MEYTFLEKLISHSGGQETGENVNVLHAKNLLLMLWSDACDLYFQIGHYISSSSSEFLAAALHSAKLEGEAATEVHKMYQC
jgi:hypothetical protein